MTEFNITHIFSPNLYLYLFFHSTIQPYNSTAGKVEHFSTSALDGNLIVWHLKALETKLKNIKIR